MAYLKESDFEAALLALLPHKGWEEAVLEYPTEEDLLKNWADILFDNNRGIDRLNDSPLTDGEMQQILEQIAALRTPHRLNGFINGKTVSIRRDNPADALHFGKEISLKIYDRQEIAAGQSRYQIAKQPRFARRSKMLNDRRGDLMLLINGMPVIHIELKRSGIPVSQACHQIEKYAREGLFTGLFSLIQIFVAMEPDETMYFANPGPDGAFNKNYYFHWADFNNEPINKWQDVAASLLSIPMAHQLIGFYTVADDADGVLKVMRSYQYYAANAISDHVSKTNWKNKCMLGGYVWHTTGSGKTMTSFKAAQLIANSKDADKVVFLMDRIELGTQSLEEYRAFADDNDSVQATENTGALIARLKSSEPADTLIVTSIQKMSNIKDGEGILNARDIKMMRAKRIVIIVDEAHRGVFGDMLRTIKKTFPEAMYFGFTGTPIFDKNQKKMNTTETVFGRELHCYSIADGIRDKNVLGFDPDMVTTYKDMDLRTKVALSKAKADTIEDALSDPAKSAVYYKYTSAKQAKMAGYEAGDGQYIKGIEDELSDAQYNNPVHRKMVVSDITNNWVRLSHNGKFHALFATSSIPEAIEYYRLIKAKKPDLKVTALFDPNIDNLGGATFKEDGLVELMQDYNVRYGQDFDLPRHAKFKKDISSRLSHKRPYERISQTPGMQIDLLIVVDQMLTGFDSKWVNTLYLDKMLRNENIIQAFSRTNRLFGPEKPFGTIRYYRRPHTMARNIEDAVKLYSGEKPRGLFVQRLKDNLKQLNATYDEINQLFDRAGVPGFEKLPDDPSERGRFAKLFKELNNHLEAAKIQGFAWDQSRYEFSNGRGRPKDVVEMHFGEELFLILALRYKELFARDGATEAGEDDVPYEIDGYLTEIDTGYIDADYMNSRFEKYLRVLGHEGSDQALNDLHKSFATLTQEEQKFANIFIHDVQSGDAILQDGKTFRDYITEYQVSAKGDQIHRLIAALGLDEGKLRTMMDAGLVENNINEFGRFDDLKNSVDKQRAKVYFDQLEGKDLPTLQVNIRIHKLLEKFILNGDAEL